MGMKYVKKEGANLVRMEHFFLFLLFRIWYVRYC